MYLLYYHGFNRFDYLRNERQNVSPTNIMFSPHLYSSRGSLGRGGLIGLLDVVVLSDVSSFNVFSENIADLSFTSSGFGDLVPGSEIVYISVYILATREKRNFGYFTYPYAFDIESSKRLPLDATAAKFDGKDAEYLVFFS